MTPSLYTVPVYDPWYLLFPTCSPSDSPKCQLFLFTLLCVHSVRQEYLTVPPTRVTFLGKEILYSLLSEPPHLTFVPYHSIKSSPSPIFPSQEKVLIMQKDKPILFPDSFLYRSGVRLPIRSRFDTCQSHSPTP